MPQAIRDMKKGTLFLTLGGILLLGSIFTLGNTLYNAFNANQQHVEEIFINTEYSSPLISLSNEALVQVALRVHVNSDSTTREAMEDDYSLQYNFPFRYRLLDASGNLIHEETTKLAWNAGMRQMSNTEIGKNRGSSEVESGFDKIKLTSSGEVRVVALLEEDSHFGAQAVEAELIVYDNVHRHTASIMMAIAASFFGVVCLIVGVLMLAGEAPVRDVSTDQAIDESKPLTSNETNTAMLIHLSAFCGYIMPFGGLIGPLVVWLLKRHDHPFIDMHGKEAINFRISMMLYYLCATILCFILIGFVLLFVLAFADLILIIIAAIRTSDGQQYRYPITIRFIK